MEEWDIYNKDLEKTGKTCVRGRYKLQENEYHLVVHIWLLTKDGKVYKGFNVENDGIQSICAERVAFVKALSEGNSEFKCIVVVGKFLEDDLFQKTVPCGYCRQFMSEYVAEDFLIYAYDEEKDEVYEYKITELLPEGFVF
jgi:cytidine deaminase